MKAKDYVVKNNEVVAAVQFNKNEEHAFLKLRNFIESNSEYYVYFEHVDVHTTAGNGCECFSINDKYAIMHLGGKYDDFSAEIQYIHDGDYIVFLKDACTGCYPIVMSKISFESLYKEEK